MAKSSSKKSKSSSSSPPPRGQKSLTSFFGAARSSKTGEVIVIAPKKVQGGIKSAFRKGQSSTANDNDDSGGDNDNDDVAATTKNESKKDDTKNETKENEDDNGTKQLRLAKQLEKNDTDNDDNNDDDVGKQLSNNTVVAASKNNNHHPNNNNDNNGDGDLMDTDDDDDEEVADDTAAKQKLVVAAQRQRPHNNKKRENNIQQPKMIVSKKRIILEDSDSDEEEEEYKPAAKASVKGEQPSNDNDDDDTVSVPSENEEEEDALMEEEEEPKKKKAAASSKKQKTLSGTKLLSTTTPTTKSSSSSSTGIKKSEVAAKGMKSNTTLLKILADDTTNTWTVKKTTTTTTSKTKKKNGSTKATAAAAAASASITPYSAMCDTFSAIEEISSRLEIQEKLTELFRLVLLQEGGGGGGNDDDGGGGGKEEENNDDEEESNSGRKNTNNNNNTARSDLYTLLYLASNSVAPQHSNVELGVGDSILIKAIGEASGTNPQMIKKKYDTDGDLGTVAQTSKGKQKTLMFGTMSSGPKTLNCVDVLTVFREIANVSGSQSQKWKVDKIKSLLVRARGVEPKYIIRGLQGKLRIGLAQTTVLASLAHAIVLTTPKGVVGLGEDRLREIRNLDGKDGEFIIYIDVCLFVPFRSRLDGNLHISCILILLYSLSYLHTLTGAYPDFARKLCSKNLPLDVKLETAVAIIKKAYSEVPSFDSLLDALLSVPLQEVHKACTLKPGIPVEPMLAKPTKSVLEVLKRLNGLRFTCEYKYDGERAQVHMTPEGGLKVFSRSLLNTSEKFPEVPLYVQESCKDTNVTSFVLDTEVVAFNRETKQFVPFQVLSTRKRTEENAESAKVQVIVQAFDLMYLNGESLLDRPLAERRDLLHKNFKPVDGKFQFAMALDHTENGDTALIEEFLENAVKGQCEGLMVKTLDVNAAYEPSRRSLNWLKLKKDYLEGLGDSVDLVPIGAYHGKGKRTGVYGAYLLACYDEDSEEFQSVCKIGTGFSDEDLKELAASLNNSTIPEKSSQYNVSDSLACDVWFDAVQVWEVKAADLSKSSTHKGAIDKTGEAGRGIGLRFPRFERLRPDKKPEDATTSDQILDMYYAQDSIVGGDGGGMAMDGI